MLLIPAEVESGGSLVRIPFLHGKLALQKEMVVQGCLGPGTRSLFSPFPLSNLVFPKVSSEAASFEVLLIKGFHFENHFILSNLQDLTSSVQTHLMSFPSGNCGLRFPLAPESSRRSSTELISVLSLNPCLRGSQNWVHAAARLLF